MKNVHGKEKNILLKIQVKDRRFIICDDSTLDSVIAFYGTVITAAEMKDREVEICIGEDASVVITDIDKNEVMTSWNNEHVNELNSTFLFYALSEKFELLLYRSQEPNEKICLKGVPKRNPSTGEILSKIETLPNFKTYTQIQRLIVGMVCRPYKNKYTFGYNQLLEDSWLYR